MRDLAAHPGHVQALRVVHDVLLVRERRESAQARHEHLDADEEVLYLESFLARLDRAAAREQAQEEALPKGEEDDALDEDELHDGVVRPQEVLGREVKDDQAVERHRVADVHDEDNVDVPLGGGEVSLRVVVVGLEDEDGGGEEGLGEDELQGRLLALAQKLSVHLQGGEAARHEHVARLDHLTLGPRLDLPGTPDVKQAERVEVIQDPSLVTVPDRRHVHGVLGLRQGDDGTNGLHGHHEDDAYDVPLKGRGVVVHEVHPYLVGCENAREDRAYRPENQRCHAHDCHARPSQGNPRSRHALKTFGVTWAALRRLHLSSGLAKTL